MRLVIPRTSVFVRNLGYTISRVRLRDLKTIGLEQFDNCSSVIGVIENDFYRTQNRIPIKNNNAVQSVWAFIGDLEYSDKRRQISTGYILTEVIAN